MADWAPSINPGESEDKVNATTNSTDTWTIRGHYKAQLTGKVSAGAARITIKTATTGGLAVAHLDLDFSAAITDMVVNGVQMAPGDEVKLVLDSGATGMVSIRLMHPREA